LFIIWPMWEVSELDSDPSKDLGGLGSCPLRRAARGIERPRRWTDVVRGDGVGPRNGAGRETRQLTLKRKTPIKFTPHKN